MKVKIHQHLGKFYSGGDQKNRAIFGRRYGDKRDVLLKIYIK